MAKKIDKKMCSCCGSDKRLGDFYKSSSKMNKDTGRMNICKICTQELYDSHLAKYKGDAKLALFHTCLNLDAFFSERLFIECSKNEGSFLGEYFRRLNGEKETRDKTSRDNSISNEDEHKLISVDDSNELISSDIVDFWGEGFNASTYAKLERKYKMYSEHYPNKRLQEQEIIKQLCELSVMKEDCRISGKTADYDKISTQIRKTMEDLNVLPKQSADEEEQLTLGNIIKMIEYDEPIPMTSPEFDDVNKIEKIMEKYFITPFKRVLGLKNKDFGGSNE